MQVSIEQMKRGTCGCGRSPTGDCIGWHSLTQEEFEQKVREYKKEQAEKNSETDSQN